MKRFRDDEELIIEREVVGSSWVLMRREGNGRYFFIKNVDKICMGPMLHLYDVSNNFFKCRSIACALYDAFIISIKQ
jgi:hypothetical protein